MHDHGSSTSWMFKTFPQPVRWMIRALSAILVGLLLYLVFLPAGMIYLVNQTQREAAAQYFAAADIPGDCARKAVGQAAPRDTELHTAVETYVISGAGNKPQQTEQLNRQLTPIPEKSRAQAVKTARECQKAFAATFGDLEDSVAEIERYRKSEWWQEKTYRTLPSDDLVLAFDKETLKGPRALAFLHRYVSQTKRGIG